MDEVIISIHAPEGSAQVTCKNGGGKFEYVVNGEVIHTFEESPDLACFIKNVVSDLGIKKRLIALLSE
jgi:hypothetical protein